MSGDFGMSVLGALPKTIRDKFDVSVIESTHPKVKIPGTWGWQLWMVPKREGSPTLIYACSKDTLWDAADPEHWLVDQTTGDWLDLDWYFPYEFGEDLRRFASEDLVEYEVIARSKFSKILTNLLSRNSSRKSRRIFLFEKDAPPRQWEVVEIRRFNHW